MSLAKIDPRHHGALRAHGWLLALWAFTVGLLSSALLLHVFKLHSLPLRYALGAGSIYLLGFVWGGYHYARWWNTRMSTRADLPTHASQADEIRYQRKQDAIAKRFSRFNGMDFCAGGGDDPLSALLGIIALSIFVVFLVLLLGYAPLLVTDLLAGYLAEIVLEFVIGAMLLRKISRTRALDHYWGFMLRKTLMPGLLFIVVAAVLGWLIQLVNPDAQTLLQAFR